MNRWLIRLALLLACWGGLLYAAAREQLAADAAPSPATKP